MAEIIPGIPAGKTGRKKYSTRIDLTPMVDLGFLLITFFVFTTALSLPKTLKLVTPTKGDSLSLGESAALSVIPAGTGMVFYYNGDLNDAVAQKSYGLTSLAESDGIGQIIRDKKAAMETFKKGSAKDLTLMIKPSVSANMQEIVSLLDEVSINAVSHYCLLDAGNDELAFMDRNHFFQKAATR